MSLFKFWRKKQAGETPDNAILITDVPSHKSGVAKEYEILKSNFGIPGQDWSLLGQSLMHHKGRKLDRMEIQLRGNTKRIIYFDVTYLFSLPDQTPEEIEAEVRYRHAQSNLQHLFKALSEQGSSGFNEEFDKIFPPETHGENNEG